MISFFSANGNCYENKKLAWTDFYILACVMKALSYSIFINYFWLKSNYLTDN